MRVNCFTKSIEEINELVKEKVNQSYQLPSSYLEIINRTFEEGFERNHSKANRLRHVMMTNIELFLKRHLKEGTQSVHYSIRGTTSYEKDTKKSIIGYYVNGDFLHLATITCVYEETEEDFIIIRDVHVELTPVKEKDWKNFRLNVLF